MSVVVTGAAGKLGRAVVEALLARVPAQEVTATVRRERDVTALSARGVRVHLLDYDRPETMRGAFRRGDRVLLVSSNSAGERHTAQHRAVVGAAARVGVGLIGYTSVLRAPAAGYSIGRDHHRTEQVLAASGVPCTLLRNGWYNENYTGHLDAILQSGRVFGCAGAGRVAAAARADYAEAAAEILTGSGHDGRVYELAGDVAFGLADLASEISRQTGRSITHPELPAERYRAFMIDQGVPAEDADQLAPADAAIARGELASTSPDLRRLIGRPTTPIAQSVTEALAALRGGVASS